MLLRAQAPRAIFDRRILVRTIGAALGFAAAGDTAAATAVLNCGDAGAGSLRAAVVSAASGDTIDMSALQCSSISLELGALVVSVKDLTLVGPATGLAVNGHPTPPYAQVFVHLGTGTLTLRNMTMQQGVATSPRGGCVSSNGNVVLDHANVNHCSIPFAAAAGCPALGGGVYAKGDLTVLDSTVTTSVAQCYSGNHFDDFVRVYGGGLFAGGSMIVRRSSITDNGVASGSASHTDLGLGGGLSLHGNLEVTDSTIARNSGGVADCGLFFTHGRAGGIFVPNSTSYVSITNSTISGNVASDYVGGIFTAGLITVSNSTIAFNSTMAFTITPQFEYTDLSPGLVSLSANLQSSIIANNKFDMCNPDTGGTPNDMTGLASGANNLIMSSASAPAGSLTADPQLDSLADNGGSTQTHKLGAGSPAIAQGNNALGRPFDQRGPGYARTYAGAVDIGAFQTGDSPFTNGFE